MSALWVKPWLAGIQKLDHAIRIPPGGASTAGLFQVEGEIRPMRILGILALVFALTGCTGDRLNRQSANEQRQAVVVV